MPGAESTDFSDDTLNRLFAAVAAERHLALAVSGGSDSLALLHLARRWAGERKLTVLTVDHSLRAESAEEARWVKAWSEDLDHVILIWDGDKPLTGIPAKARIARYRLMTDWCRAKGVRALLTAHTIDDQAETVFMRIARGAGVEGLAGIFPVIALHDLTIHRPLLAMSRQRLRAHLTAIGQPWLDDPSNDDDRFERARVRKALPNLGVAPEALALLAARALEAHTALDAAAEDFLHRHGTDHAEGCGMIDRAAFAALPGELKIRVLARHLGTHGGRRDWPAHGVERRELELLVAALERPGTVRRTLGGCVITQRRDGLSIGRELGRAGGTKRFSGHLPRTRAWQAG